MFNKVILIGRLGQNAEAKTAQNNRGYVVFAVQGATSRITPKMYSLCLTADIRSRTDAFNVQLCESLNARAWLVMAEVHPLQ